MKNYLLLWVLFPFCIWAQQIKPIDQNWPKGTSWSGDTNLFTYRYSELDSDKKYLEWRGQKKSSSHIYHPLTYGKRMKWELKFDIWVTRHQNRPNYLSVNLLTMKNEEDKDVIYTLYLDKERKLILMREIEGEETELISSGTIFAKSLFFSFTVNVTFDVSKKKWDINYVSHDEEEDNVVLFSQSFSEKDAEKIKPAKEGILRFKIYSPHKRIKSIKIKKIQFYVEGDESNDDDGDVEQEDPEEPEEDFKFSDGKKINEKEYEINFNKKIETWSLSIFYYPQGELADFIFNKETQKGVTVKIEEALSQPIQYFSFKNLKSDGQLIPIFYLMVQEDGRIVLIDKEDVPPEYFPDEEDPDEEQDVKKNFIFTEIMCDPKGAKGLPETEYIEIRSLSEETVNIKGLSFQYGKKEYSLPSFDVISKQYAVLYKKGKKIDVDDQGVLIPMDKFPVLANKGKHIALWDGEELLDEVTYNTKMYGNKVLKGVSLERDEECDSKDDRCWYASTDPKGGTPGAENSEREKEDVPDDDEDEGEGGEDEENPVDTLIHAKEFIFTEIMYDPKGAKGLPETEYIEIRSLSEETVNTKGLSFQYDKKKYSLPSFDVANGQYAVLYKRGEEIDVDDQGVLIPMDKFPILANKGKYIALLNGEELLDEITYSPKMYGDKVLKGVSLERDEECDSKDDRCWYASSDPKGGTPGAENSEREKEDVPDDDEDEGEGGEDVENPVDTLIHAKEFIFTEIMYDPKGAKGLPETEYIEIRSLSEETVNTKGLSFQYDKKKYSLPSFDVANGQYAVLYKRGEEIDIDDQGVLIPMDKFPILANKGKYIALLNGEELLDEITYSPKMYGDKVLKGVSLERDEECDSKDDRCWYASSDPKGGTPGAKNSERKEVELPDDDEDDEQSLPITPQNDVVINEILFAPKNDGVEFLEIYNRSGKSVDLQGLAFAMIRQNKQIKTYYPMTHYSQLLLPNGYCVISKSTDKLVSHYPRTEIRNCIENKHPILPDGGGTIALINRKDQSIIDYVSYSPKWHDVQQSKAKGFSLERKNVDYSSNDPKNWGTALEEEGKATPGFVNSRITDESDMPTAIEDPIWDSKDNSIIIKYRTDLEGAFCNAYLFNVAGHLIERPAQQQLLGQYGQWKIKINQSKNILPGIYVLLIEIYHPTGKTERIKKVIYI